MSALARVVMVLVWAMADGGAGDQVEQKAEPPAKAPLGATLILPRPRRLPCERFQTVAIEVGEDGENLSYDEAASVSWTAAGRDWSFVAKVWKQPPAPLSAEALPNRAHFTTTKPHRKAHLTFYCRRYEMTEKGSRDRDSDPFLGVEWSCTVDGCTAGAGYGLPWSLARSRRRLRLCDKTPPEAWKENHRWTDVCRDIAPAFEDRHEALALGAELVADARRAVEDVCRPARTCDPRARASLMNLVRAGHWQPQSWSGLPAGLRLSATDGARRLDLDCSSHMGDGHCTLTLRDRPGEPLLTYVAIDTLDSPAEAVLWFENAPGFLRLTAASGNLGEHDPGGCDLSGPLLWVK